MGILRADHSCPLFCGAPNISRYHWCLASSPRCQLEFSKDITCKLESAKHQFFATYDPKTTCHSSLTSSPNKCKYYIQLFFRAREPSGGLEMQWIAVHPFFCKLYSLKSSIFHKLSFQKTHSLISPLLPPNTLLSIIFPALLNRL